MQARERIVKFVSTDDPRMLKHSGFGHRGIEEIAHQMMPDLRMYGFDNVFSGTLKSWDGVCPLQLGWLVIAEKEGQ